MLQKFKNLLGINLLSVLGWVFLITNLYWIIPMLLCDDYATSGHIGFGGILVVLYQAKFLNCILGLFLLELLIKHFFHKQFDITYNCKFLNISFYLGLILLIPILLFDALFLFMTLKKFV